MEKKLLGWALFFLIFFSLPIHAQDSSPMAEYLQGKTNGERNASISLVPIFWGCLYYEKGYIF
jgi:hypothetical protein